MIHFSHPRLDNWLTSLSFFFVFGLSCLITYNRNTYQFKGPWVECTGNEVIDVENAGENQDCARTRMAKIHVSVPWSSWLHVTFHCSQTAKTSDWSCHFHHLSSLGTKHCLQCYRVWIEWYHDWWWTCSIRSPALQYFHRIRMSPPSTSWFLPTIILKDSQLTSNCDPKRSLYKNLSEMKNLWNEKSLKWKMKLPKFYSWFKDQNTLQKWWVDGWMGCPSKFCQD